MGARVSIAAILGIIAVVTFGTDVPELPPSADWMWMVPASWFGLIVVGCLWVVALQDRGPLRYLPTIALVGAPAALVGVYEMADQLQWCTSCTIRVASALAILVLVWQRSRVTAADAATVRWWPVRRLALPVGAGAAIVVLILGIQQARLQQWLSHQPRVSVPESAGPRGDVTIVVFSDYQCPACRAMHELLDPEIDRLVTENRGHVTFTRLDFPLDAKCNESLGKSLHPFACEAAVLARLAGAHGRRAEAEQYLYEHQQSLSASTLDQLRRTLGIDEAWEAEHAVIAASVSADARLGASLGVDSTPTYFINGLRSSQLSVHDLKTVVLAEARRHNQNPSHRP